VHGGWLVRADGIVTVVVGDAVLDWASAKTIFSLFKKDIDVNVLYKL